MKPGEIALRTSVLRSLETTAQINQAIIKAAHGEAEQRDERLARALTNAEYLVTHIKTVQLTLEADKLREATAS